VLFRDEKIIIYHPGKCGGTTIEHLFLRSLRKIDLAIATDEPCFHSDNNARLTTAYLHRRLNFMVGYLAKSYEINGVSGIYLQHADIQSSIKIHGKTYIDSLYKIVFIRNPFSRILSSYYYNGWDKKITFRDFILTRLRRIYKRNQNYTVNHFGDVNKFTHYDGEQYVDFIGKLEKIDLDVEKLSRQLRLPLYLGMERKHAKTVESDIYQHYSQAYDDQMVDLVYRLYQKDFELFDYRFERKMPYNPTLGV
jgi:hypothetical protein